MVAVYLHSFNVVTPHGLGLEPILNALVQRLRCPQRILPDLPLPMNPQWPTAGWIDPLTRPAQGTGRFNRFARLDRLAQLALVTANLSLEQISDKYSITEDCGVAIGTTYGSHLTNEMFQRQIHANGRSEVSPSLFAYTLPSAAAAEVSMHFHFKGPPVTLANGESSALSALSLSAHLIQMGATNSMLVGGIEVLSGTLLAAAGQSPLGILAEGAAFVFLSSQANFSLAQLIGFSQVSSEQAGERAVTNVLEQANMHPRDVMTLLVYSPPKDHTALIDDTFLDVPYLDHVFPHAKRINYFEDLSWSLGNSFAAAPLQMLAISLARSEPLPILLLAQDSAGQVNAVCLTQPGE
jgi:hypothetical protein